MMLTDTMQAGTPQKHSGEPNNFGGVEDCGYLLGGNHGGTWNDGTYLSSSRVALWQWPI